MRTLFLAVIVSFFSISLANADGHSKGHPLLTPLEPAAMDGKYTDFVLNIKNFQKNSGFDPKTFHLMSLSAAVGLKCQYCIVATTAFAKKAGASEEEIKSVIMIASLGAFHSSMLTGNLFDLDKLRKAVNN